MALTRKWEDKSLKWAGATAYNASPGSIDPDQPLSDVSYKLTAEYAERASHILKISYLLSYVDAIDNPRADFKNKARLQMGFHPSPQFSPGFSFGLGYDKTSGMGYDYLETDGSFIATLTPDDKNGVMAMLYMNRRSYDLPKTMAGSSSTGSFKGKGSGSHGAPMPSSADNVSLNFSFSLLYSHEITDRWEVNGGYNYLSFGNKSGEIASHKVSIGLTWRLNPL
jgi:opacity protein-like surface antigen